MGHQHGEGIPSQSSVDLDYSGTTGRYAPSADISPHWLAFPSFKVMDCHRRDIRSKLLHPISVLLRKNDSAFLPKGNV